LLLVMDMLSICLTAAHMHTSMFPFVLHLKKKNYPPSLHYLFISFIRFVKIAIVQVKGAQLWGTDIYTNDSDLVAGRFLLTVLSLEIVQKVFLCTSVLLF